MTLVPLLALLAGSLASRATAQGPQMSGSNGSYAIAHGALMCAVWVLLIPFGILVARHRWLVDLEGLRWAAKSRLPFIILAMVRPYTYRPSDTRR